MINLDLNIVSTLILAIVLCLFGNFIKNKFSIFNKVCIPTPVIGGLFFSLLIFILRKFGILEITMDTSLMRVFRSFSKLNSRIFVKTSTYQTTSRIYVRVCIYGRWTWLCARIWKNNRINWD